MEAVEKWVSVLLKLKDAALTYKSPSDIVSGYSEGGEGWFAQEVLKDQFEEFCCYPDWERDVYKGIRRSQPIAFAGDWNPKKEVKNSRPAPEGDDRIPSSRIIEEIRRMGVEVSHASIERAKANIRNRQAMTDMAERPMFELNIDGMRERP